MRRFVLSVSVVLAFLGCGAHSASAGWTKARAHYDRDQLPEAIAGFSVIALAARPDLERCEAAANLALDAMNLEKDYSAIARFMGQYERSACAAARNPRQDPPEEFPSLESSALDALAFLDGCWRHWDVDWGFTVCWERAANRYVGSVVAEGVGAGAGKSENFGLVISYEGHGLLIAAGATSWTLFELLHRAEVSLAQGRVTIRSQYPLPLMLGREGELLVLTRGESTYRLKAVPQRSH